MKILESSGPKTRIGEGVALTDVQILLLTLWGEGRGEPIEGRIAIGCVIRNRVRWGKWGESYARVCLAPYQFSCWRSEGGRANHEALLAMAKALADGLEITDQILRESGWIAHGIIGAWIRDNVQSATHYYNPDAMVPKGRIPAWALNQTPVATVGEHLFFRGVK